MKVVEILEVSVEELYKVILESLVNEIKEVHPRIKEDKIVEGYKYKKKMVGKLKQSSECSVKIKKLVENKEYLVHIDSDRGLTTVNYILEEVEHGVRVIYEEDFISKEKINNLNHKLMMFFYKRSSAKKMRKKLFDIEKYIISNR
ncbi:MAG: DUF3284 domain-containing protein [Anaerorhabdus sp.]